MANEENIECAHCNSCLRITKHEIIALRRNQAEESFYWGIDGSEEKFVTETIYKMLECRGCNSVILERVFFCADLDISEKDFFPPPISRQIPHWFHKLPYEFSSLMKEIYQALHADSRRLAIMGCRALVDLFMNKTIGDIGGFKLKIERLVEEGYLSKKNKEIMIPVLETSHAVTHRAYNPSIEDVNIVFDIVENLIQTLVFEKTIGELKKNTPKRK